MEEARRRIRATLGGLQSTPPPPLHPKGTSGSFPAPFVRSRMRISDRLPPPKKRGVIHAQCFKS